MVHRVTAGPTGQRTPQRAAVGLLDVCTVLGGSPAHWPLQLAPLEGKTQPVQVRTRRRPAANLEPFRTSDTGSSARS